jgi:hypothetical protein
MNRVAANVRLGVIYGLAIGGTFALGSLITVLVRGATFLDDYRISLLGLIAFNLVGGAGTGAIAGLLLPLAKRSAIGASAVGFVAMLPISFIGMLLVTPPGEWREVIPLGAPVGAALLGGLIGPALRSQLLGE